MTRWVDRLRQSFALPQPPAAGIYHYRRELDDRMMRLHLRIEDGGEGLLSVNASGVLHLNATAATLMKYILDGLDRKRAVAEVRKRYRAKADDVARDYDRILGIIERIETEEDACPLASVDVPDIPPFGREVSAPYRADLALTYACNNRCVHCYVSRDPAKVAPMALPEWCQAVDRLWEAGVPHVCFTGGEATLSPHLLPLIEHAEDIGVITGLLSNGCRLANQVFTKELCDAGLDHVQITLESHDPETHDRMVGREGAFAETVRGIENALAEDIYLVTNTTICALNAPNIDETVSFLKRLGVRQFAMNSFIATGKAPGSGLGLPEEKLEPTLGLVCDAADEEGLRFIWYTPTRYCDFNPTAMGIGFKRCTAAEYSICIEPDGQVLPCQSYYQPGGHILKDSWRDIWESTLFREIRQRLSAPDECRDCADFPVCGAGCPLSNGERFICQDSRSESAGQWGMG